MLQVEVFGVAGLGGLCGACLHWDSLDGFYSPHLALSRWSSFRRIGMTVVDRAMILALASIS